MREPAPGSAGLRPALRKQMRVNVHAPHVFYEAFLPSLRSSNMDTDNTRDPCCYPPLVKRGAGRRPALPGAGFHNVHPDPLDEASMNITNPLNCSPLRAVLHCT